MNMLRSISKNPTTMLARRRGESGMTTAEYTVGTLGACTVGGVLVKVGHT